MSVDELPKRPELIIRDILTENWDASRVEGYDPTLSPGDDEFIRIHTGTYEAEYSDPQISISHPTGEAPASATDSGYTSQSAAGNPQRDMQGTPLIQIWAAEEPPSDDGYRGDMSARSTVFTLRKEVERIAHAEATPEGTPFDTLSTTWDGTIVDEETPPVRHANLTAQYLYMKEQP